MHGFDTSPVQQSYPACTRSRLLVAKFRESKEHPGPTRGPKTAILRLLCYCCTMYVRVRYGSSGRYQPLEQRSIDAVDVADTQYCCILQKDQLIIALPLHKQRVRKGYLSTYLAGEPEGDSSLSVQERGQTKPHCPSRSTSRHSLLFVRVYKSLFIYSSCSTAVLPSLRACMFFVRVRVAPGEVRSEGRERE